MQIRSIRRSGKPTSATASRMRAFDRDLIREGHYGQRSCEPHTKAVHMAAPTRLRRAKSSCQQGAVPHRAPCRPPSLERQPSRLSGGTAEAAERICGQAAVAVGDQSRTSRTSTPSLRVGPSLCSISGVLDVFLETLFLRCFHRHQLDRQLINRPGEPKRWLVIVIVHPSAGMP